MDLNFSQYRYRYRILSECGPRWKNEDTIRVVEMPEQGQSLFILCDGMGGTPLRRCEYEIIKD